MKLSLLIISVLSLAGCSLTVSPDGSRQWALSGAELSEALKAIPIHHAK